MNHHPPLAPIRDLIARDDLDAALQQLRTLLDHTPRLNEVVHQSGRFENIQRQIRLGLVSHHDATMTRNQIRDGLLDLLRTIEQSADARPTYNRHLTRALVEALRPYNDKAARLCQDFAWLEQPDNRRKVQQFVFQHFVGEVGKQLRKLVNIGDDDQLDPAKKQRHYVQKCLDVARRALDLVNYTLLSVWWDAAKKSALPLAAEQQQVLADFFEKNLEHRLEGQFHLLQTLCTLFERHGLDFPFPELTALQPQLAAESPLHQACRHLEAAAEANDAGRSERELAAFMAHFAFLTAYRMVSVKKIGYRQMRNGRPEYLHRYVALGIDVKYSEDAEKGRWISLGEQSPAVLLHRGDEYRDGISLFPFVIDYNALTFEQGAKICFFSTRDLTDEDALEYRFLGDNSLIRIEKQGIVRPDSRLDDLMMNPEHLKAINLDCVVDTFHEARRDLLAGAETNFIDQL